MTKIYQLALLAVLGLAGASTIQAQSANYTSGDLLVGFTVGSGTDSIYDLGSATALTEGQTWDLSALLLGVNLNTVNWGVIGGITTPLGSRTEYTTLQNPPLLLGTAGFNSVKTALGSIAQNFSGSASTAGATISILATDQNSWFSQMENPSLSTQYGISQGNPDVMGLTSVTLNSVSVGPASAVTALSPFSLDKNGTLTYGTVPEPSTAGLLAGGAVLAVCLRNQFRRKQA